MLTDLRKFAAQQQWSIGRAAALPSVFSKKIAGNAAGRGNAGEEAPLPRSATAALADRGGDIDHDRHAIV